MSSKKVLVAYGTRYGSARIVALEISEYLKSHGNEVSAVDLRNDPMPVLPGDFDLVIAGSSIAMFSWIAKVKVFLKRCAKSTLPTVVFITCGTAIDDPEKARVRFMDKVLTRIRLEPVLILATAPVIDFRPGEGLDTKLKGRIKGTIQAMAKDNYESDGLMDMRDRPAFDEFLKSLDRQLT